MFDLSVYFYKVLGYVSRIFGKDFQFQVSKKQQEINLQYLKKECSSIIKNFEFIQNPTEWIYKKIPQIIWVLWWQGNSSSYDNIPQPVQVCLATMKKQKNFKTILLTQNNIFNYINLEDVLPLFERRCITIQTLSDIIRVRILEKFGGFWCDASLLFLSSNYLEDITNKYSLFSNKLDQEKYKNYVSRGLYSGFFWGTYENNPMFSFANECMTQFIVKHKKIIDYVQIDYTFILGYLTCNFIKEQIDSIPCNNPDIWWLNDHFFEKSGSVWEDVLSRNKIQKISSSKFSSMANAANDSIWVKIKDAILEK